MGILQNEPAFLLSLVSQKFSMKDTYSLYKMKL